MKQYYIKKWAIIPANIAITDEIDKQFLNQVFSTEQPDDISPYPYSWINDYLNKENNCKSTKEKVNIKLDNKTWCFVKNYNDKASKPYRLYKHGKDKCFESWKDIRGDIDLTYCDRFFDWIKIELNELDESELYSIGIANSKNNLKNNLKNFLIHLSSVFYLRMFHSIIGKKRSEIEKSLPFFTEQVIPADPECRKSETPIEETINNNKYFKQYEDKYFIMYSGLKYKEQYPIFCIFEKEEINKNIRYKLVQLKTKSTHLFGQKKIDVLENKDLPICKMEETPSTPDVFNIYVKEDPNTIEYLNIEEEHCFKHHPERIKNLQNNFRTVLDIGTPKESNFVDEVFINVIKNAIIESLQDEKNIFPYLYINNTEAKTQVEPRKYPIINEGFFLKVDFYGWRFYPVIIKENDKHKIITFYEESFYKNGLKILG